jgi:hypothetical protein
MIRYSNVVRTTFDVSAMQNRAGMRNRVLSHWNARKMKYSDIEHYCFFILTVICSEAVPIPPDIRFLVKRRTKTHKDTDNFLAR